MTDVVTIPMNGFTGMTDNEMLAIDGGSWEWKEFAQSTVKGQLAELSQALFLVVM